MKKNKRTFESAVFPFFISIKRWVISRSSFIDSQGPFSVLKNNLMDKFACK